MKLIEYKGKPKVFQQKEYLKICQKTEINTGGSNKSGYFIFFRHSVLTQPKYRIILSTVKQWHL